MNSVELVKSICKERKIPISKLERDLGYANGYIGQLRKGTFPSNRVAEIAQYLSIPTPYLMNGGSEDIETPNEKEQPTVPSELSDVKARLIQYVYPLTDEQAALALRVLKSILEDAE